MQEKNSPKKKTIYLVCWYLLSFPGGAEKSIVQELKRYQAQGYETKAITFDEGVAKGRTVHEGIEVLNYPLPRKFANLSRYCMLALNQSFIKQKLTDHLPSLQKAEVILTQSINAPLVAAFCRFHHLPYHYYLRDENNLNIFVNYEQGFRRVLKQGKDLLEHRCKTFYIAHNREALRGAKKIIANSQFMKQLLQKKFHRTALVRYPDINYRALLHARSPAKKKQYITFLGAGNAIKGDDIAHKIAQQLPRQKFLFVGRVPAKKIVGNITYIPWEKNIARVYAQSRIIIMPSRWMEAFGRVVLEANHLGIPVITSNKGGLPEANKHKDLIVEQVEDVAAWLQKLKQANKKLS
ncbi:MAG: glycosyltransferase family 4 protein [Candidatus Woesearchaeota archaeon]|nr:MAG: glycosyltransferase family 4 protein [Candidatus Woesearchaeota archaeon]